VLVPFVSEYNLAKERGVYEPVGRNERTAGGILAVRQTSKIPTMVLFMTWDSVGLG
jgi:hypothetical protein